MSLKIEIDTELHWMGRGAVWPPEGARVKRLINNPSQHTLTNHLQWLATYCTRPGLVSIHVVSTSFMIMEVISNFTSKPHVNHTGSSVRQPVSRDSNSECYTGVYALGDFIYAPYCWNRHGHLSRTQWYRCIPNKHRVGHLLNLPHISKSIPRCSNFGRDMLFQIPFLADWNKIGECRQRQTDQNMERENHSRCDWDYAVGDQVLLRKDGILRKGKKVRAQLGTISEQFNIRRVIPIFNNQT